jgi:hypothetical protein
MHRNCKSEREATTEVRWSEKFERRQNTYVLGLAPALTKLMKWRILVVTVNTKSVNNSDNERIGLLSGVGLGEPTVLENSFSTLQKTSVRIDAAKSASRSTEDRAGSPCKRYAHPCLWNRLREEKPKQHLLNSTKWSIRKVHFKEFVAYQASSIGRGSLRRCS